MALTMNELKALLKTEGIRYFLDPDRPTIMFGVQGLNNSYQCIISVELDGEFLQFRTVRYLNCPSAHPSLTETLKVLGDLNYSKRIVKFGWDASDGEIVAYVDMWLKDNNLTEDQFSALIHNFLLAVDMTFLRLKNTVETGKDPGDSSLDISKILGLLPLDLRESFVKLKMKIKSGDEQDEDIEALLKINLDEVDQSLCSEIRTC